MPLPPLDANTCLYSPYLGDHGLVVAALAVGHPHRLLGVVGLQGVLFLHLEGDIQEIGWICNYIQLYCMSKKSRTLFT